jgi:spermidine/putrescine transport system ATP-binding protein
MIAGFEWPTEGEVYIDGKEMGHTPPFLRPVNTVFQSYALFQHMSIFQNVAFGLEMEKTPNDEIKRRVGAALEMVQLTGMDNRKPRQLSGGQQQRVALARALVKRPAVLLLDEPLGALDLKLRKEMQLELKSLQHQVGITFIYVTHDQEEALTMSNRIAVMERGKALQIGSPVEIYERPNCRFVADFIGESNFLHGRIRAKDGNQAIVYIPLLNSEVIGFTDGSVSTGQEVVISIRPEKIRITDSKMFTSNLFDGVVKSVTYIGSETRVVVNIGDVELAVWEQNRISTLDLQAYYSVGQIITIHLFPENTLVLPVD